MLASLVPWAAFLGALAVADRWVGTGSGSLAGLIAAAPVYLGFVALPSFLVLLAARRPALRAAVLALMTAVAVVVAVLVVTTEDAQAGLMVFWVANVGIPLALVLWAGQAVVSARQRRPRPASGAGAGAPATTSDRLAALAIDVVLLGSLLVVPLTRMSHAGHEVAAGVSGVAVSTSYFAALVAWRGRTIGQSALRLRVVDSRTGGPVPLPRALVRSLVVVLEVAATPTMIFAAPAIAEVLCAAAGGRSLTDRIVGTAVTNG